MSDGVSERVAQLVAGWYLPYRIRAVAPHAVLEAARRVRARVLGRGLPRNAVFEQPAEQKHASASMSVIVAIHDAPAVTLRCLESLERYATQSEIILVDDGSRLDETTRTIREFSDRNGWKVVRNTEALGHSSACATGAHLATRPYLCLLNSDTVLTPWCWLAIEDAFATDPSVGVAGPSTSFAGNEQTLDVAWQCRFYWNDSQICAFAERLADAPTEPGILDLPWVSGFAFFIRRSLWEQLGGFNRSLSDYGNEVELCKRVGESGFRTVWVRNAYIHHLAEQSYGETLGNDGIILARIKGAQFFTAALLERGETLLKTNIEALTENSGDPERFAKLLLLDMENEFQQVKAQVTTAVADQHLLQRKLREHEDAVSRWNRKAEGAAQKAQADAERVAKERSLSHQQLAASFAQQLEDQVAEADKLRTAFDRLQRKVIETRVACEMLDRNPVRVESPQ